MLPLTTVTLMLHVPLLLGASPVHVTKDTLEMEPLAMVINTFIARIITLSSDIDECTDGVNNCDSDATCTDTLGSFYCVCKPGYTGNGTTCVGMLHMHVQMIRSH